MELSEVIEDTIDLEEDKYIQKFKYKYNYNPQWERQTMIR